MQEKRMNQSLLKRQPLLELCELFVCGLALTVSLSVPLRFAYQIRIRNRSFWRPGWPGLDFH